MSPILLALLPNGLIMCLGATLRSAFPKHVWLTIDKLNFQLLFPVLIFYSAASRELYFNDVLAIGGGVLAIILLGCLASYPLRLLSLGPKSFLDFAGTWQTAWRFNTAIAIIAVQAVPESSRSLMSLAIGFAVPLANILAVLALSHGQSMSLSNTLRAVALNPFFVASIGGLLASSIDFYILVELFLQSLSNAATPLALLSIGASIHLKALAKLDVFNMSMHTIKLVVLPATTLLACKYLNINNEQTMILAIFAALPTASAAHILASMFGADRQIVATIIAQSTLLACLTLPIWMSIILA